MDDESALRHSLCEWGKSLFERGLTSGSSGNISVRLADGFLITPTNSCLGLLQPERLSKIEATGRLISGDKPSKEIPLHLAFYKSRPAAKAVVHLHSTYATALSCLRDSDPRNTIPPLTPYVLMRAGRVPLIAYSDPGTDHALPALLEAGREHSAVLLANHGPVVSAASLDAAIYAAEELEEAAKLVFLLGERPVRYLPPDAVERLLRWSK